MNTDVPGRIRYSAILEALDISSIEGVDDYAPSDWVEFDSVEIDEDDIPENFCHICGVCGGVEPEPEHQVDPTLLAEFLAAIMAGDTMTARCLVNRVFDDRNDARLADAQISRLI